MIVPGVHYPAECQPPPKGLQCSISEAVRQRPCFFLANCRWYNGPHTSCLGCGGAVVTKMGSGFHEVIGVSFN